MNLVSRHSGPVADEYQVLARYCGRVQARCSDLLDRQAADIAALQRQVMRLRAEVIVRDSALAWEREDLAALHDDPLALEASLAAADLVICQTGCLSHDDYWRVQDHCRRTGKACVLVARPDAVRIVRMHGE
jgi:hypothetical protein